MRLRIEHKTIYRYSAPVFPEPHHLFFYPDHRPHLQLIHFQLDVVPTPSGLALRVDAENNTYHQCWFDGVINAMQIEVKMEVESKEFNFLDFIVEGKPKTDYQAVLQLYRDSSAPLTPEIRVWIQQLKAGANGSPVNFIALLCAEIRKGWTHAISYETDLVNPASCFESRTGSCRDLSWMMMEILRDQKIPARFVSGYCHNPELEGGHELHAWVEAWVAGAGWIGADPSSGLLTTAGYVPVAASYHPVNTLPVQGSYRGDAVSTLETSVHIEVG